METNGGSSRDAAARRRRIAERGSDRLALITGRIQSLPSSTSLPQSHQSTSIPPNPNQLTPSDESTDFPLNTESETGHNNVQPVMPTKPSAQESSRPTTLTNQNPPTSTSNKSQTLSPNRLRPAISSSQKARTSCSCIIAVLVLLSYANFPIVGSNTIKSILLFRPLVLLVLTNITIVAAPLLLEKTELKGSGASSMDLGKALEWGMVLQSGLSSLFMDCSVYSVVVISGMAFLQKLGW